MTLSKDSWMDMRLRKKYLVYWRFLQTVIIAKVIRKMFILDTFLEHCIRSRTSHSPILGVSSFKIFKIIYWYLLVLYQTRRFPSRDFPMKNANLHFIIRNKFALYLWPKPPFIVQRHATFCVADLTKQCQWILSVLTKIKNKFRRCQTLRRLKNT